MRLPTLLAGIVSFALAVSAHAADPTTVAHSRGPGYDLYRSGPAGTVSKSTPRGGVLMMGGGEYFPQAFEWLFDRGGHGRLVVLRASGEGDLNPYFMDELGGVAAVDTLVFSGREASSDPTVLAVVKAADMIFIGGGDRTPSMRMLRPTNPSVAPARGSPSRALGFTAHWTVAVSPRQRRWPIRWARPTP